VLTSRGYADYVTRLLRRRAPQRRRGTTGHAGRKRPPASSRSRDHFLQLGGLSECGERALPGDGEMRGAGPGAGSLDAVKEGEGVRVVFQFCGDAEVRRDSALADPSPAARWPPSPGQCAREGCGGQFRMEDGKCPSWPSTALTKPYLAHLANQPHRPALHRQVPDGPRRHRVLREQQLHRHVEGAGPPASLKSAGRLPHLLHRGKRLELGTVIFFAKCSRQGFPAGCKLVAESRNRLRGR
jgi:hypothetical protein